jgi:RimJ/RimL family protein N-acetyltransferase
MVGQISFHTINLEHRSTHLGPILVGDPALRGKGIGSQMISKMQEIAFEQLKLHRIDLYVFDFNKNAIAC